MGNIPFGFQLLCSLSDLGMEDPLYEVGSVKRLGVESMLEGKQAESVFLIP